MKKAMLVLLVALLSVATVNAQFKVGLRAGFNASTISNLPDIAGVVDVSNYYLPGFQAGLMAQYLITPQFGIESGLYFSQLGTKQEFTLLGAKTSKIWKPYYLQLPLTVLYKIDAGLGLFLSPQVGGYLGYGVGGKIKTGNTEDDFFNDNRNNFDAGLTFGFNVEHSGFVIGLGYDLGLLKINKNDLPGGDLKNGNIKVTVGYFF